VSWAAGEPSCEFAETADVWEYIERRGWPEALYRFQVMLMSDAPLANPATTSVGGFVGGVGGLGTTGGEVRLPFVSNTTDPVCVAAVALAMSAAGKVMV